MPSLVMSGTSKTCGQPGDLAGSKQESPYGIQVMDSLFMRVQGLSSLLLKLGHDDERLKRDG